MESTIDVCVSLLGGTRFFEKAYLLMFAKDSGNEMREIRDLGLCSYYYWNFISLRLCNPLHQHTRHNFSCDGIGDPGIHLGCMSHFHHFLYQHNVTIYTNHTAIKAVLETDNPTESLAEVSQMYVSSRKREHAHALSGRPHLPAHVVGIGGG